MIEFEPDAVAGKFKVTLVPAIIERIYELGWIPVPLAGWPRLNWVVVAVGRTAEPLVSVIDCVTVVNHGDGVGILPASGG